ncbi:hypothetical protein MRB53_042069 [Persea americana]|nr:hypothetical protein MRB53_042069 [Persea americana]
MPLSQHIVCTSSCMVLPRQKPKTPELYGPRFGSNPCDLSSLTRACICISYSTAAAAALRTPSLRAPFPKPSRPSSPSDPGPDHGCAPGAAALLGDFLPPITATLTAQQHGITSRNAAVVGCYRDLANDTSHQRRILSRAHVLDLELHREHHVRHTHTHTYAHTYLYARGLVHDDGQKAYASRGYL